MQNVEKLFTFINEKTEQMASNEEITYLEALLTTLEKWLDGEIQQDAQAATKEEIRKAVQLAILKGMRQSSQVNHQMTPDSLGILMAYFVEQLSVKKNSEDKLHILDLAVGTGNLLFSIMNYLGDASMATAVEVDELLIRLAAATADLLEQPVDFFLQDTLRPLFIDPVDAVVCDLPVGYYPDEEVARGYELFANKGLSYAHHLIIEQAVNHTKPGGYLYFLVPETIFESALAQDLHKYLVGHTWIQAVVQLPSNLFKNSAHAKSILIVQKQFEEGKAPKEVLLAKVPSLSNKEAVSLFFDKFQIWKSENK